MHALWLVLLSLVALASTHAHTQDTAPLPTAPPPPPLNQPPPRDPLNHLVARQATSAQSSGSSSISIPNTAACAPLVSLLPHPLTESTDPLPWNSAGGLTYLTPAATAAASYYKIAESNPITFGWNYTSL